MSGADWLGRLFLFLTACRHHHVRRYIGGISNAIVQYTLDIPTNGDNQVRRSW